MNNGCTVRREVKHCNLCIFPIKAKPTKSHGKQGIDSCLDSLDNISTKIATKMRILEITPEG